MVSVSQAVQDSDFVNRTHRYLTEVSKMTQEAAQSHDPAVMRLALMLIDRQHGPVESLLASGTAEPASSVTK
jgi:hypothetical protein